MKNASKLSKVYASSTTAAMHKTLTIVQVCRRFGPVGGMERYVWELSHELATMGHTLHILCEEDFSPETIANMHVHALGTVRPKPRWLAHIRFSHRVHAWLEENRTSEMIIHSHERCQEHHITTFHGPPFAQVRDFSFWKRISLRVAMNLWLERRELCNQHVQTIVPNSMHISKQLKHYYPNISNLLSKPILPGVASITKRPPRPIAAKGGNIGFIGKEWKRKGLEKAIAIVSELAKQRPNMHFFVAGPKDKEIAPLFKHVNFQYSLLGLVNSANFYQQLDILLHPAKNEPFGMVITEALTAGVPVVISDVCGAASEVSHQHGSVLTLDADVTTWTQEISYWLSKEHIHVQYQHSWHDTAMTYMQLYQQMRFS